MEIFAQRELQVVDIKTFLFLSFLLISKQLTHKNAHITIYGRLNGTSVSNL